MNASFFSASGPVRAGRRYLVKITRVDLARRAADVLYVTGETETGVNLDDLAFRQEMRLLPG